MHQPRRIPALARVLVVATAVAPLAACDLWAQLTGAYDEPIDLEVELESPPVPLDVSTQVTTMEGAWCATDDAPNCLVLKAIDRSDDEALEDPPSIPAEFPIEVAIEDDEGNALPDPECTEVNPLDCDPYIANVEQFFTAAGLFDAIDLAQVVPLDLTEQLEVSSPEAVQEVSFSDVGLMWVDNMLTFDTVDLDLYMTLEFFEEGDAPALIADGSVTKIGTIDRQLADTSGKTPINFIDDEAEALFNEGLKSLKFTIVIAAPEGTQFTLNDGEAVGTKRKPFGEVGVSMVATLVYSVTPSALVGDARDAYNESGGVSSWFGAVQ
jgi:hypothetical protein